ncbi:MAG: penicillin acylase family protein [Vicinamibacteria bacterium]|nr:penicillin acylase family protein [Vicinamibacteria bacterium]
MRRLTIRFAWGVGLAAVASFASAQSSNPELARWEAQARQVTIVRDDWGIPHIHGRTDAGAVFGLIYAQAEDDFNRIETNYLNSMGRLAEAEGETAIYQDLRMRLFIDPAEIKALYLASPASLKALMNAWADGLNFYLHTHPSAKPRVIKRFEPWMALTFSEGSIGGDIERVNLRDLEAFYGKPSARRVASVEPLADEEPRGSNGIAISPSHSASGHALLLINPHTSFFFRAEVQVTSDEGLNAYGAVTWGQFFVYQGFNDRVGWMHTSSGVDNIDEYVETIVKKATGLFYRYGAEERPVKEQTVTVAYKTAAGMARKEFTTYRTHHGPIIRAGVRLAEAVLTKPQNRAPRAADAIDKWISVRLMEDPLKALTQSFTRTKARNFKEFRQTMDLHTNSSNNTIYADADGATAYFHANFIPKRDPRFDWRKPVDGSDPATEWGGPLSVDESPLVVSPKNGWLYNSNNWPYSAAGADSPKKLNFPGYVEEGGENPRGIHAIRVLSERKDFTVDSLITAAYDSYLPAFASLLPALIKAYDEANESNPLKVAVGEQIKSLRDWDFRWSVTSAATSLAVFWGEEMWRRTRADADDENLTVYDYIQDKANGQEKLEALAAASDKLAADFGKWNTPWGDINRFQRLTGDLVQPFSDDGPSIPVGFTSSRWGSLASFGARAHPNTKRWYGTSGNSFVAVVEFGDRIRARAITAGGESGDPTSAHFNDEAARYAAGDLREVYFYPDQLKGHTDREYHPGH